MEPFRVNRSRSAPGGRTVLRGARASFRLRFLRARHIHASDFGAPPVTSLLTSALRMILVVIVAAAVFAFATRMGWLSFLGVDSESHDSQVINAIERTEEV